MPSDEEKYWLVEALSDAADHNDEFNYSDVARVLGVTNNAITRHHPFWGWFNRKSEYDKHREWKREKYASDPEWRNRLLAHNNGYFAQRYANEPEFRDEALGKFRKWTRSPGGKAYRLGVKARYHSDSEFRGDLLGKRAKRYRAKDPLMRFLDNVDLESDKEVVLGRDFPSESFEVLAFLSTGRRMTPTALARRIGRRSPKRIQGVVANMHHAKLLDVHDFGVTGRYGVSDYGLDVLGYVARNTSGGETIDMNKHPVVKRPRIRA